MVKSFFASALALILLGVPQVADAKEFKYNWKRSLTSGGFDQDTSFFWVQRGPDGVCRVDNNYTVKVKKKPKKGTLQWVYISRVLTTGECAGTLASGYQFIYTPKRKPKKDRVVLEIKGLDRMSEGKLDVDKARIDIQIKKR